MIQLTENAIEHLRSLLAGRESEDGVGLRLEVERGGCAGLQYGMRVDEARQGDEVTRHDGVALIVDPESLKFLDGSVVDYVEELNDSGFKVRNPNAARSCGCGTSFEPAQATA
jgi:iron-sulfur cluster assembly accessory protein